MNNLTDNQLLADYAERRSEAAFAELVRRHVDLVHSAALRLVRDAHSAQDVTQGVFVALAQNARQLTRHSILSGWLHCTTRNLAANAVRADVRRRGREQEAAAMNELLSTEPDDLSRQSETQADTWEHIAPHLDDALGELSEPDRAALLLRYFERKSAREMAQTLGVTDEAAQKRVSRAVERLREFFAKRGITVGASGLVVVITANAVQAAPVGLAVTISTAAALAGTTITTTIIATATKAIAMTTLQKTLVAATFVTVGLVATLVVEHRDNSRLRAELAESREQVSNATNSPVPQLSANDDADRARRQTERSELLRLRGQVALLRSQLQKYAVRNGDGSRAATLGTPPVVTADTTPLVSAAFVARVPVGHTLISGGWISEKPGKRIFMLSSPVAKPNENSVDLQTRLVEVTEAVWNQLGWEDLRSDPKKEIQGLLGAAQTAQLLKSLEGMEGVDLLSAPRITTGNGQEAQLSIGNSSEDGIHIGVTPTQTPDGGSFDLSLNLQILRPVTNSPGNETIISPVGK